MSSDNEVNISDKDNTMNCLDVCRQLNGDAYSDNDAIKNHIKHCDSCAAYAAQQNKLTDALEQAINISVPEGLASRILLQQSINDKQQNRFQRKRVYAIAASVVLTVSLVSGLLLVNLPIALEQVALTHVKDELNHLKDNNDVQLVTLNRLLKPFNMKLNSEIGTIKYAGSCTIRNSKGVHIVVETASGPVTILLMPGEFVKNRKLVDDALFTGSVVPIENGSFAIIGEHRESLSDLEKRFKLGISYI